MHLHAFFFRYDPLARGMCINSRSEAEQWKPPWKKLYLTSAREQKLICTTPSHWQRDSTVGAKRARGASVKATYRAATPTATLCFESDTVRQVGNHCRATTRCKRTAKLSGQSLGSQCMPEITGLLDQGGEIPSEPTQIRQHKDSGVGV